MPGLRDGIVDCWLCEQAKQIEGVLLQARSIRPAPSPGSAQVSAARRRVM